MTQRVGECGDDEVVVGGYPWSRSQLDTMTGFPLLCAELKDTYELYDRVVYTQTWGFATTYQCPDQEILVGQRWAPGRCQA